MSTERDDAERDVIASAGARRDDEIDAEADESLRGMRSVWLSMRDEEPPSSGLAELMAAARSQAMAKKPAPWWQRALDVMRRPPVLALASAVILVAGAVVVGREVSEPTVRVQAAHVVSNAAAPADESAVRDGVMQTVTPTAPAAVAAPEAAPPPPAPVMVPEGTSVGRGTPARKATAYRMEPKPTAMPKAKREAPMDDMQGVDEGGMQRAKDSSETAAAPPMGGAASVPMAEAPKSAAKEEKESGPSPSAQFAALVRAARRGDCAETQRLFKELAHASNAYAMRASKDPAIARCLPPMGVAR